MRSIGFARVVWGFVLVSCGFAYDPDELSKGSPAGNGGAGGAAGAVSGGTAGVGGVTSGGAGGALGGSGGLGGGGGLGGSSGLGASGGLGGVGATGGTSSGGAAGVGGSATCGQPGDACCSTGLACPTNNNKAQCCNNCSGFPDFQCTCNLSYKADGQCRLCCVVCKDGTASSPEYVGPSETCDGAGSVFCTGKGGVEASKTGWKKSCT